MVRYSYGKVIVLFFLLVIVAGGGIWRVIVGTVPLQREMIELNGNLVRWLNLREINRENGGVVLSNGYVVGIYPYASLEYEIYQIKELKRYLDEKGIELLYVNEPTKYIDDIVIAEELGRRTYINNNTDRFLAGLAENEIRYLDLREEITRQGIDSFSLFYKTDHHWTTMAGKMAAQTIAAELNRHFGYNIDVALYDSEKYIYREYDNVWLGEQGRKLGVSYVGLDDFTLVLPNFETCFEVSYNDGTDIIGSFEETLVDESVYIPERNSDIYNAPSWHYSYMGNQAENGITYVNGSRVVNCMEREGKTVLVLGDSYAQTMIPFLALGVSEVQCLVLRDYSGSLREYIDTHNIDIVIVAYASFMLGAHDEEGSANYAMFDFQ